MNILKRILLRLVGDQRGEPTGEIRRSDSVPLAAATPATDVRQIPSSVSSNALTQAISVLTPTRPIAPAPARATTAADSRLQGLKASLMTAMERQEVIRVIYHAGSQPGTFREIRPINMNAISVFARDLLAGMGKTFMLEHLEIVDGTAGLLHYDPSLAVFLDGLSIGEAFSDRIDGLQACGWHVEPSDSAIALYSFFKNGRRRKTPEVHLRFDGGLDEHQRRYHVFSRRMETRSHRRLTKAAALFLYEAAALAPNKAVAYHIDTRFLSALNELRAAGRLIDAR